MTKKQEETFKDYVRRIEDLTDDYRNYISQDVLENGGASRLFNELKEVRIEFFEWAKKQFK